MDTAVAWIILSGASFWALIEWARAADRQVEHHINAALATPYEIPCTPTGYLNEDTEDWLFESPEFKTADADRAEAVLFAASVMADIDDLPEASA